MNRNSKNKSGSVGSGRVGSGTNVAATTTPRDNEWAHACFEWGLYHVFMF